MSKEIESKVLEMKFDNSNFEKNVQTSLSTIDKLKRALKLDDAAKGFEGVEKAAGKCKMSGFSRTIETVQAKFSAMEVVAITALSNITNSALHAGKQLISALTIDPIKTGFQEYETQINAIQTILANTESKGSTLQDVNNALDELNHYADKTIYNFTEMTRNIGTFTAAGVDLNTSVSAIKGIANLAAVSGSTSQQASTAMYQLSQALAAGTVKLQDWNSVVNAGMGGQVFQDSLKETARVHGIAIDQMIADEGSFRETLSKGWLTSEILTETLAKFTGDLNEKQLRTMGYADDQIAAIIKMGQTANDAATKVKTFTQLFDTLKEAAQSGWTESWEIIIGDFGEAKELLTEMSDIFGEMIGDSANERNTVLMGGLSSGWKQLLKEGIADAEGYKESVISVAKEHGIAIDDIIEKTGSFENSLKEGWATSGILSEALTKLTDKTRGLSDEELSAIGYTRSQVEELEKLDASLKDGSISIDDFAEKISKASGRENLIDALRNSFEALMSVIKPIGEAFREIFPPVTAEQIYNITVAIKEFTSHLKLSGDNADKLRRTFKGLFAIFDILGSFVKEVLSAGFNLLSEILGNTNINILDTTASVGDAITAFRDWIKSNNIFATGLKTVVDILKTVISTVRNWINEFMALPQVQEKMQKFQAIFSNSMKSFTIYFRDGTKYVSDFIQRMKETNSLNLSDIGNVIQTFWNNTIQYFTSIRGEFGNLGDAVQTFKDRIGQYFKGIWDFFDGTIKKIVDFITILRTKFSENVGMGEILTVGLGTGLIIGIRKIGDALETFSKPLEAISSIAENFGNVLGSLSKALNSFALKTKSEALIKIATAIAILVGSIAVLTLLDQGKLMAAIGVLAMLATGLIGVSAALGVLQKVGDVKKGSLSITAMAAALLILVSAMKKMEELDESRVAGNLVVLGVLGGGLTAFAAILSKTAPQLSSGSIFLLSFAASMKILVSVLDDLGSLNTRDVGKTIPILITAIGSMAAMAAVCKNLQLSSAASILAAVVALKLFIGVFKDITKLDTSKISSSMEALVTVFGSFAILMVSSKLAGEHAAKAGVGILAMSAALLLIVSTMKQMAKMDPLDLERATDSISQMLLVFAGVVALSKLAGEHAAKAGVMMLLMSGAIGILSGAMVILSHIDPSGLDRALSAVIKMEAVFGALIAVTHLAQDCKSTLIVLTVAIGALAIALGTLSMINSENLAVASASLSAVIGMFSLLVASTGLAKKANLVLVELTFVVGALALMLASLSQLPAESTLAAATALSEVMLAFSASLLLISKAGTIASSAYLSLGVMTLITAGLGAILAALASLNIGPTLEIATSLSILLVALSASCLILSGVGATGAAAFIGVGALVTLITAIGGLMAGIGALAVHYPRLEEFMDKGIVLLEGIGNALGSFFGNIVGGFLTGATAGLPKVGSNISQFIENATPFFNGIKNIDASSMTGVKTLAETILILTAADILRGLTSWLVGSSSLSDFGKQIKEFGGYFREYADAVGNIDGTVVESSANAAKTLAEFASAIPNSGGILAKLVGENSLSEFAEELVPFGKSFSKYAESIKGIEADTVIASANAAKSLAEFASALPNHGGILASLIGDSTLTSFAKELTSFGPSIKAYADSVAGLDGEAVVNSATAAKSLAEMANNLPNNGGILATWMGDNTLTAFAKELVSFGPSLMLYAASVSNLDPDVVINSTNAAKALAELANNLPNTGGLSAWFAGDNDISSFGESLVSFGSNFAEYSGYMESVNPSVVASTTDAARSIVELQNSIPNTGGLFSSAVTLSNFGEEISSFGYYFGEFYARVSGINPSTLSAIIVQINKLVEMAKGMSGLDTLGMSAFGESMAKIANAGIDKFIATFTNANVRVSKAASDMWTAFSNSAQTKQSSVTLVFTNLISNSLSAINRKKQEFQTAATSLLTGFISGIKSKENESRNTVVILLNVLIRAINDRQYEFQNGGSNLIARMTDGIRSQEYAVINSIALCLNNTVVTIHNYYQSFYDAGGYLAAGLANGIAANIGQVEAQARSMATTASNAARNALRIRSPSKVFYEIGDYTGQGFVNALSDYRSISYDAGTNIAESAKEGLINTLSRLSELIDNSVDSQPTIRPILDLSQVNTEAAHLNTLFSASQAMTVDANVDAMLARRTYHTDESSAPKSVTSPTATMQNTFYISGGNPKEIANEVSKILQHQVERRNAMWAQ